MSVNVNQFALEASEINDLNTKISSNSIQPTVKKRFSAVMLKAEGKSNKEIAAIVGAEEHAIGEWIKNYKQSGISGILNTSGRWHKTQSNTNELYSNSPIFINGSDYKLNGDSKIEFDYSEDSSNKIIDFNRFANHEIAMSVSVNIYDKTDNTNHICVLTNLTLGCTQINFNDKRSFEESTGEVCANVRNTLTDLGNIVIASFVNQSCLCQVENQNDIRIGTFEDMNGKIEVSIPKNLKAECGNSTLYISPKLKEIYIRAVAMSTYRKGTALVNEMRGIVISYVTVHKFVCDEGKAIESFLDDFIEENLSNNGFDHETGKLIDDSKLSKEITSPEDDKKYQREIEAVKIEKIEDYNDGKKDKDEKISESEYTNDIYNDLEHSVNISIDEVEVKSQEKIQENSDTNTLIDKFQAENPEFIEDEKLKKSDYANKKNKYRYKYKGKKGSKKRIKIKINTKLKRSVAHIRCKDGEYLLIAANIERLLLLILAVLLNKNLMENKQLTFFTDGAKNINNQIKRIFSFRPFIILIDWFHVKHKCYEYFTMALKGGEENYERNNEIRQKFFSIIFAGNIYAANEYVDSIDGKIVKNYKYINEIKDYLERKREYIYCFALMKELHLQNASSCVEKANDILVSNRCKRKGMSWVNKGLTGMTNIQYILANNENSWFSEKNIFFTFKPLSKKTLTKLHKFEYDLSNHPFII